MYLYADDLQVYLRSPVQSLMENIDLKDLIMNSIELTVEQGKVHFVWSW